VPRARDKDAPPAHSPPIPLTGEGLTLPLLVRIARDYAPVELSQAAKERMLAARAALERAIARGDRIYGVTTGFGKFNSIAVSPEQAHEHQRNLIRSHAAGVGSYMNVDEVRAMMVLKANEFARGHSGIRPQIAEHLVTLLNAAVTPIIPERGSVGASGDLAPLSHLALFLIGEGGYALQGHLRGGLTSAKDLRDATKMFKTSKEALAHIELTPLELEAKEGLALINGTSQMAAVAALAVEDVWRVLRVGQVAAAMSVEALGGRPEAFDKRIHDLRPHPGQWNVADNIRRLLDGSKLLARNGARVQDPYTLRAIPQVLGPVHDALTHAVTVLEREFHSVTDNPLIFPGDDAILSGANFHGQPLALLCDGLLPAVHTITGFAERRIARLLAGGHGGLPAFLSPQPGAQSGLMVTQYTAAALAAESASLCHPASVSSLPTSGDEEDYNSLGPIAARRVRQLAVLASQVVAIELLCAATALDFAGGPSAPATRAAHAAVREIVAPQTADRSPAPDMEALNDRAWQQRLVAAVQTVTGGLN